MGRSLTGPGNIAKSGDTMLGAFNEAKGNDIASTSVVNLVIATGNLIDITGGNTILSIVLASGAERVLRFTGSLRLTNSATLVCPGGADIITLAGDFATVRGYPGGVVRIVVYTRATGYVQRIGDSLTGNLMLAPGNVTTPPLKYQAGVLTTLTVPHAHEWNGNNLFITQASGVRKQLMYLDDNGSLLTGFTSTQITNALGYTPFNAGTTPSTISPANGLMEVGRYIDFHSVNSANDYDARIDCLPPTAGVGSSIINIGALQVQVTGSAVWTQASLTNLSQLANGPGYAPIANPTFTGTVTVPSGELTNCGLKFGVASADSGFVGHSDDNYSAVVSTRAALNFSTQGVKFTRSNLASTNNGGQLILERWGSSGLAGDLGIGQHNNAVRFTELGGNERGAYLDLAVLDNWGGSRILTNKDLGSFSNGGTGYSRDANGMIMQWGKRANGGIGSAYVAFPITFPNSCNAFFTSYDMTNDRGNYGSGGSVTQSGGYVHTDGCDTWWLAIGH